MTIRNNKINSVNNIVKLWGVIFIIAWLPDDPLNYNGYKENFLIAIIDATLITIIAVVLISLIMESFRKIVREEIEKSK